MKVKAHVEYEIKLDGCSYLLDNKKFQLLENILNTGSITEASKLSDISYRTALNYIDKIESNLNTKIIKTTKGGSGGGGGSSLTEEGLFILKECKKINIVTELTKKRNEIIAVILKIDADEGLMYLKMDEYQIKIPLNKNYEVGDEVLALIRYDNIFLMNEPVNSSIKNIFKGTVTELKLHRGMLRVKTQIGQTDFYCDITTSNQKDLDLTIGKEIYLGFNAMSVATLKL